VDAKTATALYNTRILKIPEATFPWFALARIVEECFWRFGRLMKKMIKLLTLGATVAALALPVAAKTLNVATVFSDQDQCSQESKDALYQAFRDNRTTDQAKAYDSAKKYLACPAGEVTEAQQKIIDYLKKWVTAYEEGSQKVQLPDLLYNKKKYPEAYALGKQILAKEPENLKVLVDLGANGYLIASLKNADLSTAALEYARKALQLLDAGKTVDDWTPLSGKDTAIAYLNFTIGTLTLEKEPENALKNLIKSAQFETPLKKSPFTYAYIAGAYETGSYAKQSGEYKTLYGGKDETPESKLALANINQIVDRMIDGYARAVALAGSDQAFAQQKPAWQESLSTWYKYRHNASDAGMNEFVASVLSKPLPPEPTPLTSLPTPAPATTPAGSTSGATSPNGSTASATTPQSTAPAGTANKTTTTTTGTKPGSNAGAKPKNNHRP